MIADLKAARAEIEEAVSDALADHEDWLAENPDMPDPGPDAPAISVSDLRTLLTALDQAAEALKPFAEAAEKHARSDDAMRFKHRLSDNYRLSSPLGDLRLAATVYATLKPEGSE